MVKFSASNGVTRVRFPVGVTLFFETWIGSKKTN